MADIDLKTDEEKAEELKQWWKENGTSVIVGIALAIGGMFGWQQWQKYKINQAEGASRLYTKLSKANDKSTDRDKILKQLSNDFSSTPYASLGALSAAKINCESGKNEACIEQLRNAAKSSQEDIKIIADMRLARVLIAAKKLDEAQGIADSNVPAAYTSLFEEIKGDIHFAKKDFDKARDAYNRAILSAAEQNVRYLKMKRDDLGETTDNTKDSQPGKEPLKNSRIQPANETWQGA